MSSNFQLKVKPMRTINPSPHQSDQKLKVQTVKENINSFEVQEQQKQNTQLIPVNASFLPQESQVIPPSQVLNIPSDNAILSNNNNKTRQYMHNNKQLPPKPHTYEDQINHFGNQQTVPRNTNLKQFQQADQSPIINLQQFQQQNQIRPNSVISPPVQANIHFHDQQTIKPNRQFSQSYHPNPVNEPIFLAQQQPPVHQQMLSYSRNIPQRVVSYPIPNPMQNQQNNVAAQRDPQLNHSQFIRNDGIPHTSHSQIIYPVISNNITYPRDQFIQRHVRRLSPQYSSYLGHSQQLNSDHKQTSLYLKDVPPSFAHQSICRHKYLNSQQSEDERILTDIDNDVLKMRKLGAQRDFSTEIAKIMKDLLIFEQQIDILRKQLLQQPDFSLITLFKIFDRNQSGQIIYMEFQEGLKFFDITADQDDACSLIKRYNQGFNANSLKNEENSLQDYRNQLFLQYKEDIRIHPTEYPKNAILSPQENRLDLEYTFQEIVQRTDVQGHITQHLLKKFLRENGIYGSKNDLNLLFFRLQNDSDDKITYHQFWSCFVPNSHLLQQYKKADDFSSFN